MSIEMGDRSNGNGMIRVENITERRSILPADTLYQRAQGRVDNSAWAEKRVGRQHFGLPYSKMPYDFLAINCPSTYEQGAIPTGEEPPIGLLRVVAAARQRHGFHAGALDAHALNLSLDQICEQLAISKPSLVGLNPTSVNVPEAQLVAKRCDDMGIAYTVGGIHATLNPAMARQDFPDALAIIAGDGELAIGEALNVVLRGGTQNMKGIFWSNSDHRIHQHAPKIDIKLLPFIDQSEYVEFPLFKQKMIIHGKETEISEGSLYTTRGCPFQCGFCASPVMVDRGQPGVRPYDHPGMQRVVEEVGHLVDLGADAVHFLDDMVIVLPRQIVEFHEGIEQAGLTDQFIWRGMTRAPVVAQDRFNDEVLEKLVASGCWRITLGVESGNDTILKMIRKEITTEDVVLAVQKLASVGVQIKAFFIMGFPGETRAQMEDTYRFIMYLKGLGLTDLNCFQFKPYPGTNLWDVVARQNPEALKHLDYVGADARKIDQIGKRSSQGIWLSDDLVIADGVRSGEVRELVMRANHDFFDN